MAPTPLGRVARATLAGLLVGNLSTSARASNEILTNEVAELSALDFDDQCDFDPDTDDVSDFDVDGPCALHALQRRGVALSVAEAEADLDSSSGRRRTKTKDLTIEWERKIYAWIVYLHTNISSLQWKMFYFKEDINSTNNTLFGVPGVRGVNGTFVDWNQHPATWIPTFAVAQAKEPEGAAEVPPFEQAALVETASEEEQEVEEHRASSSSRRRGDGLRGVPPRKKKMLQLLTVEENRLSDMWHDITMTKRRLNWLGNWMGANRRLYHGRPVLVQMAEALLYDSIGDSSRWSDEAAWSSQPEPQTTLIEQIDKAINQTGQLWGELGTLGGMIMAMKRRVHRYMHATPVHLLEEKQAEPTILWTHGGFHGYDPNWGLHAGSLSQTESAAVAHKKDEEAEEEEEEGFEAASSHTGDLDSQPQT